MTHVDVHGDWKSTGGCVAMAFPCREWRMEWSIGVTLVEKKRRGDRGGKRGVADAQHTKYCHKSTLVRAIASMHRVIV